MAVIKHISIKNSNYNAATDYLTTQHDEFTGKAVLDEQGNHIPRSDFILEGIHCDPYSFGEECEETNKRFNKNQTRAEIKAHHYIISFDPRDRDDNGLTTQQAQALGMKFAEKDFPGHEALVCTHPDGHNSAGNIHVHIVINSVRAYDVERQDFMERPGDALAGHKHHVTKNYLKYLKSQTMLMCQQESFYQVDLLHPAKVRITDREYWAQRRGQAKLDSKIKSSPSLSQHTTQFETEKGCRRNYRCKFVDYSDLLDELIVLNRQEDLNKYRKRIRYYARIQLLFIDDFAISRYSEEGIKILYHLIKLRDDLGTSTLFSCQYSPDEWGNQLSDEKECYGKLDGIRRRLTTGFTVLIEKA